MGQVWEGASPRWAGAPPHKRPRAQERGEGETLGSDGPKAHLVGRPLPPYIKEQGEEAGRPCRRAKEESSP